MVFCTECGTKNGDEALFCEKCGSKLGAPAAAVAPAPRAAKTVAVEKTQSSGAGGFFSFRTMISSKMIKFIYVLGMIGITLASIYALTQGEDYSIYAGFGGLILGNLLWRVACESSILFFSINDILAAIEKDLKTK